MSDIVTASRGESAILSLLKNSETPLRHVASNQTSAVVVALPSPMDPIRLLGDEDKHATLLFFGDAATLPDDAKSSVIQTIQQVTQMIEPFSERIIGVDRLGSDVPPALVAKLTRNYLENLRNIMQVNPKLQSYLSNATQFPTYIPHMTLGYPDYQGEAELRDLAKQLSRISFDRLALWWGDEQLEFPLSYSDGGGVKDNAEASWSAERVDEYLLEHAGVKGMKWGVRRRRTSSGTYVTISDDGASARALLKKPAASASNTEIQAALNRMKLESQFKDLQVSMIPPSRGAKAVNFVKNLMGEIGSEQVSRVAKGAASIAVENALQSTTVSNKDFAKQVGKRIVPKKK